MCNRGEGGLAFFHVCLLISLSLKFCFVMKWAGYLAVAGLNLHIGICMMGRVYNSISTEHGTNECTTLVEKSERQKRLEDVVKFIDLLKSKNHIHPDWL